MSNITAPIIIFMAGGLWTSILSALYNNIIINDLCNRSKRIMIIKSTKHNNYTDTLCSENSYTMYELLYAWGGGGGGGYKQT